MDEYDVWTNYSFLLWSNLKTWCYFLHGVLSNFYIQAAIFLITLLLIIVKTKCVYLAILHIISSCNPKLSAKPYQSTFMCVERVAATNVGGSAADPDVLILSNTIEAVVRFYCGVMHMVSLVIINNDDLFI